MRICSLLLFLILFLFGCSVSTGHGTETGGGTETVLGKVVDGNGEVASNVIVKMVPQNYTPFTSTESIIADTTDSLGYYTFDDVKSGTYNFFAYAQDTLLSTVRQNVTIDNKRYYDYVDFLKESGAIKVYLPDSLFAKEGILYIPGSDISISLDSFAGEPESYLELTLTNIPPTSYGKMLLSYSGDSLDEVSQDFEVISQDTLIITAFSNWAAISSQNSSLPCNVVYSIARDSSGTLWFGTDAGVASLADTVWTLYNTSNSGLASNFVYSIVLAEDGTRWFGTGGGVAKLVDDEWTLFHEKNSDIPDNYVHKLLLDHSGNLLVGTHSGAAIFDGENWQVFTRSNSALPHNEVYCIEVAKDSSLWFGTDGGGVAVYKDGAWNIHDSSNTPMRSNYIFEIVENKQGDMLVGSNGFVATLSNYEWSVIDVKNDSGKELTISAIVQETENSYWFGSYSRGTVVYYEQGGDWKQYTALNTIMSDYVDMITGIVIDDEGRKWIATCSGGVYTVSQSN